MSPPWEGLEGRERHAACLVAARTGDRKALDVLVAEQLVGDDPLPEAKLLRDERDQQLWAAFHKLPPRCQELLRMTVLAGRAEYRAVAEELNMPHGSIGPTRGRCLSSLRKLYDGE